MPTDNSMVGPSALAVEPRSELVFIVPQNPSASEIEFDRLCFMLKCVGVRRS